MTYATLYDWMWWRSAAIILGGLFGFLLLAGTIVASLVDVARWVFHLGQARSTAPDASSQHRKGI